MQAFDQLLIDCYREACLLELKAIKPGNVGDHGDGHGMQLEQFITSAQVSSLAIVQNNRSVGQRILSAASATHKAVADNTNLGIILLAAPIIHALQLSANLDKLKDQLVEVLRNLTIEDAQDCYLAIKIALPGGMGQVDQQDVNEKPSVTLLQAMQLAEQRDRIAYQYTHNYEDIFGYNLGVYQTYLKRWGEPAWAATAVYLRQLMSVPDTLIARKFSVLKAREISAMIAPLAEQVLASQDPKVFASRLLSIDGHLKNDGINPGTTADLTVATIFVAMLEAAR